MVLAITQLPGIEWDDEKGANVSSSNPAQLAVWNAYVAVSRSCLLSVSEALIVKLRHQKNPEAKRFRNRGWHLFGKMEELALLKESQEGGNVDDLFGEDAGQEKDNTDEGGGEDGRALAPFAPQPHVRQQQPSHAVLSSTFAVPGARIGAANSIVAPTASSSTAPPAPTPTASSQPPAPSEHPLTTALSRLLTSDKDWLDGDSLMALTDAFRIDQSLALTYNGIWEHADFRRSWVRKLLVELRSSAR